MGIIKYQSGGGIRSQSGIGQPTTADSLALLQNTLAYKKYISDKNYTRLEDGTYEPDAQDKAYQMVLSRVNSEGNFPGAFISNNKVSSWYPISKYRINRNPNQYYQRDNQQKIIDLDAPMHLYDRRIKPHTVVDLVHKDAKFDEHISDPRIGDAINYQEYHPLQVTPFNMLNQKQKIERQKMFGVNPGEPDLISPKPQGTFKKPSSMVYIDSINKTTPKGLPTFTQPTPQMRHMPDRIEKDSRTGAEYKGINVSHYTDALGRYTAKLNKTTTPGVKGRISYQPGGKITIAQNGEVIKHDEKDRAAIDYYANWLSKRKSQLQNNINTYNSFWNIPEKTADEEFKRQTDRMSSTPTVDRNTLEKQSRKISDEFAEETLQDYDNSGGLYIRQLKPFGSEEIPSMIAYNFDVLLPKRDRVIHERTHSAEAFPQRNFIDQIRSESGDISQSNYWDDSNELYSRLMEFRRMNNIDPEKKYKRRDLKRMRKDKTIKDPNLLKRYDDNFMLRLLNDVAQNPSNINRAKKGGIIKYQNGTIKGGIPMAQNGLVANKYSELPQFVFSNTPEYRKLYEEGRVGRYDPVTNTYALPDLEGVEIKSTDQSIAKAVRDSGGQFWRGVGELMSQPQKRMMEGITGKEQYPSEAIGFKDPKGFWQNAVNFGIDVIADPVNLLGAGLAKGLVKQPIKNLSKFSPYLSTAKRMGISDNKTSIIGKVDNFIKSTAPGYRPDRQLLPEELTALREELATKGILSSQKTPNFPWKEPIRKGIEPWSYGIEDGRQLTGSKLGDVKGAIFGGKNPKYMTEEQWIAKEIKNNEIKRKQLESQWERTGFTSPPGSITDGLYQDLPDVKNMPAINKIKSLKEAINFRDKNRLAMPNYEGRPLHFKYFNPEQNRYATWHMYLGKPQTKHPLYDVSKLSTKNHTIYTIKKEFMDNSRVERRLSGHIDEIEYMMNKNLNTYTHDELRGSIRKVGDNYVVPDNDGGLFGTMGGFNWQITKMSDGNYKAIANDIWDLQPLKNLRGTKVVKNIEVGKALGIGKPLDVKVGFIVDGKTKKIINTFGLTGLGTGAAIQSQKKNTTFRSHKVGGIIKGNSGTKFTIAGTPTFNKHPLQPVKITQKKVLPKLNMYQAHQSVSETTNRPKVTPSADTVLPEPEKPKVQDTVYIVNKGDSLWKIAKEHGTDLDTLKRNNPQIKNIHRINVGDSVIVKKQLSGTASLLNDYRYKSPFELDELNASTSDIDKLHLYESSTPSSDYYVVEDKKAHTATVYQSGKPIVTVNTATGKNKGDDLTVTTTGGRGKDGPIIHGAGNMSTPAGMFRINSTAIYRGNKSFQRSKVYEDYNIASSVHTGNVPSDKEQCNISNGCTRITPEGANQLSKYVGKNTRWYILPEKETTGQFKLTGAGISFISNNIQKLHSEHAKGSRRFSIDVPNHLTDNDDVKAAISVLTKRKSKFIDRLQISSDTYDKLSAMVLGVMGRESGFNRPGIRGTFGMIRDDAGNLVGKNVSAGPYQLRETSVPKDYIKDLYGKEVPITYEDLMNTETSTELTMLALYDIYKNIAPRYQEKYPDMSLEEITLAYYTNPQGVIDPSKSELRKKYAKDVLAMAKSFRLNYS